MKEYEVSIRIPETLENPVVEVSKDFYEEMIQSYPEGISIVIKLDKGRITLDFFNEEEEELNNE